MRKRNARLETVEKRGEILVENPPRHGDRIEPRAHFFGVVQRIVDGNFANKYGRDVMHPCDPPQEREDCLHILPAPTQRTRELVEDEKARLQAVEKMIDLLAGAGLAAPAGNLWGTQS